MIVQSRPDANAGQELALAACMELHRSDDGTSEDRLLERTKN
jgi:hypothetical protein